MIVKKHLIKNQFDIFIPPAIEQNNSLSSWLDEAASLRADNNDADETALILRILGDIAK